ncbi:Putative 2-hydroxyacid dehydrogenase [Neomoorella glycerini]|uniref:2-hydroxyacid dehydrogenase n=1 Tax=Neomoorella glycerini TaxID=55779 RepID=A0A6I5ZMS0_9FIRM|nr:D-glycerate dehydrogenase [Moorella glycerini]QGP91183.1 Putative 2-hydroxyacid dehydrogenase [Moorella glycerini]
MAKWNVYVTRLVPQPALDLLAEYCDLEINPEDRVLTRAELLEKVRGRDGILCLLTDILDDEVFTAAKGVKIFANVAVGFNNVDLEAATRHGIMISNTPGVLTEATADMAWALLFTVARRVVEGDKFTRAGKYKGWGPLLMLGQEITGKTLGVIGAGRIGTAFARKAKGFDMKILYHDVQRSEAFEAATGGTYVDKETLLKEADFVSLHVPLMPSTTHLISTPELKLMKKTSILINTSRGPVVDEKALVKALQEKEIWGAGLDVFENEPELAPGLAELDNVVLCPHIASATWETRTNMALMAANNLLAALRGELPPQCLNPEVYYRQHGKM